MDNLFCHLIYLFNHLCTPDYQHENDERVLLSLLGNNTSEVFGFC